MPRPAHRNRREGEGGVEDPGGNAAGASAGAGGGARNGITNLARRTLSAGERGWSSSHTSVNAQSVMGRSAKKTGVSTNSTTIPNLRRSSRHSSASQSQTQPQLKPEPGPRANVDLYELQSSSNPSTSTKRHSQLHLQPHTSTQSHSQFQSQSQSQTQNSFLSISTAPLPERYTIHLALPADVELTRAEYDAAYVRGEELLSDGWRRGRGRMESSDLAEDSNSNLVFVGSSNARLERAGDAHPDERGVRTGGRTQEVEGRISELRARSKFGQKPISFEEDLRENRIRPGRDEYRKVPAKSGRNAARELIHDVHDKSGINGGLGSEPVWYTAELIFPCVCSFERLKYAYTPTQPAPVPSSLPHLPVLYPHSRSAAQDAEGQIPTRLVPDSWPIEDLLEWSTSCSEDLDPFAGEIQEFELLWHHPPSAPDGYAGPSELEQAPLPASQTSDNGTVVVDDQDADDDGAGAGDEIDKEDPEARKLRKGKFRAVEPQPTSIQQNLQPDGGITNRTGAADRALTRLGPTIKGDFLLSPVRVIGNDGGALNEIDQTIAVDIILPPSDENEIRTSGQGGQIGSIAQSPRAGSGIGTTSVSWEEETKRRKQYWRKIIRIDTEQHPSGSGRGGWYGGMWEFLPLPYSNPARQGPFLKTKQTKRESGMSISPAESTTTPVIPPYKLPRSYRFASATNSISAPNPNPNSSWNSKVTMHPFHPFHPDLLDYIASCSKSRVYWLIPIHGPVLIPTLNHPLVDMMFPDQPVPSQGLIGDWFLDPNTEVDVDLHQHPPHYGPADPASAHNGGTGTGPGAGSGLTAHQTTSAPTDGTGSTLTAPKASTPIRWSKHLLLQFLETFLRPLHGDTTRPFGPLSYAFSGPKPDPYIDLPPVAPLVAHAHARPHGQANKDEKTPTPLPSPVRLECGDHLRIYCDAQYALKLRTWLHNVRLSASDKDKYEDPPTMAGRKKGQSEVRNVDGTGPEPADVRIFYKTRLTLVGERGEVLIVA